MELLTDFEQGLFYMWLRNNLTTAERDFLRQELPLVANKVLGLLMTKGIPAGLYNELQALVNRQKPIEAIKRLRQETGWTLKDCKDFVDKHFRA